MNDIGRAFAHALDLIAGLDAELVAIVLLSLRVSLSATLIAFAIGAPLGAALAIYRVPGRGLLLVVVNALLGLPPVVAGLLVYLLVSRSGPLGSLGILFTPAAMILAQTALATPIVVALVHRHIEGLWADYGDVLLADGASRPRAAATLFAIGRAGLVTAFLAAFGRAVAEVGAILIVGGNIRGHTRTMTTAITLETSKGDLPLALGLGIILVSLSLAVSVTALSLGGRRA
ncbi:MAG TPA: ABC transporter permease [Methyloceanibacter sp.]|jgi:tungstate transport system permease protein|nr:ABC transporter permease [Methyloceanibacter sp.]